MKTILGAVGAFFRLLSFLGAAMSNTTTDLMPRLPGVTRPGGNRDFGHTIGQKRVTAKEVLLVAGAVMFGLGFLMGPGWFVLSFLAAIWSLAQGRLFAADAGSINATETVKLFGEDEYRSAALSHHASGLSYDYLMGYGPGADMHNSRFRSAETIHQSCALSEHDYSMRNTPGSAQYIVLYGND